MPTLDELLKKHGVKTMENPTSGPRAKLMYQADKMIAEIAEYENASEMNGENAKFWWAPQSVNGKRKVTARYGGRAVDGLSTYVDDTLSAVKAELEKFRAVIEDSDDDTWAHEEAKRQSKS
jgi:hypothetical protein